ncbi:MAG: TAXI family TRAP transporter solute-binding subunit [Dehalococcoidia bacterium]|nr:TAXI family TRAP transporter solute-binding subunit [Dehalococcoidia bacterium]
MSRSKGLMVFCLIGILALLIAGCNVGKPAAPAPDVKRPVRSVMSLGTREIGTTSYAVDVAVADAVTKFSGMRLVVEPVGGVRSWGPLIEKREMEIGSGDNYDILTYFMGTKEYSGIGTHPWMRQMYGSRNSVPGHLLVRKDSGVESWNDLVGKKVFASNPNMFALGWTTATVLKRMGIADKVTVLPFASTPDAWKEVIAGKAVGLVETMNPAAQEADKAVGIKLIPYPDLPGTIKALNDDLGVPGSFFEYAYPANYLGMSFKTDIPVIANVTGVWVVPDDLPEETVYKMVEAADTHYNDYKTAFPRAAEISLERTIKFQILPFHSGVVKYLKDKNMWTPEVEAKQNVLMKIVTDMKKK